MDPGADEIRWAVAAGPAVADRWRIAAQALRVARAWGSARDPATVEEIPSGAGATVPPGCRGADRKIEEWIPVGMKSP
jgi:hypothetical protein